MGNASGKPANVSLTAHGIKRKQYLPRPARGGGQVLFRLVLGRTSLSGSGTSLLFFWLYPNACSSRKEQWKADY
jgi:hypothetical protein